jgi:hypothetical protein
MTPGVWTVGLVVYANTVSEPTGRDSCIMTLIPMIVYTKFVYLYLQIDTSKNLSICRVTGGRNRECF